jgi:hypothetical protein
MNDKQRALEFARSQGFGEYTHGGLIRQSPSNDDEVIDPLGPRWVSVRRVVSYEELPYLLNPPTIPVIGQAVVEALKEQAASLTVQQRARVQVAIEERLWVYLGGGQSE